MVEWFNPVIGEVQVNWGYMLKWVLQLGILLGIISFIYNRFIRQSQAEQLLKGVFLTLLLFVILWGVARALNLPMLEVVFGASIHIFFIGLIVIFQPELRRMLLFLGQSEFFGLQHSLSASSEEQKAEYLIRNLTETVHFLSKSKRGALIVLESPNQPGTDYLEVGTTLDAALSTELLLTIFHPNTPLHDGAVVVSPDNRIVAAGVLLPLTEDPELSWQYGTRHRAAIGLSEISDSSCLVVSEETGHVSLAQHGKLIKMENLDDLRKHLERLYNVTLKSDRKKKSLSPRLKGLFSVEFLPASLQRMFYRPEESPSMEKGAKSSRKIS